MERDVVFVFVVVVMPTRSQIFADTSEPGRIRGRQKYPTYQGNFRGRKSNSLMNLCGKKFWTIHRTSMKLMWWMVLSLFFCSRGFRPQIIATDTGGGSVRVVHRQLVHFCLKCVCFQKLTALLNPFRTGTEVHLGIHWPRSWNTIGIYWGKHCTGVPVYCLFVIRGVKKNSSVLQKVVYTCTCIAEHRNTKKHFHLCSNQPEFLQQKLN